MAQLTSRGRGKRVFRIQFETHRKFSLTLRCSRQEAEAVRSYFTRLENLRAAGIQPAGQLLDWARSTGDDVRVLLTNSGLVHFNLAGGTLDSLIAHAESVCANLAPRTKTNQKQYHRSLREYFSGARPLASITAGDCDQFCRWLSQPPQSYGPASVAKRIKHARQIFGYAVRQEWVSRNPFAGIRVKVPIDQDRRFYVTPEAAAKVIEALDGEDKLVFALARWAGFRVGSEIRSLRWCDIDWDTMTMRVWSPKTKLYRVCPIFVELQPYLQKQERGEYVCQKFVCDTDQAYRHRLERAVKRAGLEQWPDLLLNLRRSRATEVAEQFGSKAESDWIGHSPDISRRHYQMTLQEKIDIATGRNLKSK